MHSVSGADVLSGDVAVPGSCCEAFFKLGHSLGPSPALLIGAYPFLQRGDLSFLLVETLLVPRV